MPVKQKPKTKQKQKQKQSMNVKININNSRRVYQNQRKPTQAIGVNPTNPAHYLAMQPSFNIPAVNQTPAPSLSGVTLTDLKTLLDTKLPSAIPQPVLLGETPNKKADELFNKPLEDKSSSDNLFGISPNKISKDLADAESPAPPTTPNIRVIPKVSKAMTNNYQNAYHLLSPKEAEEGIQKLRDEGYSNEDINRLIKQQKKNFTQPKTNKK